MAHTEKDRVLLPTNAIPVHYDLHLTPSFQTFTFEGKEQIRIKVLKQTNTITVHAVDIKFYSVKIEFPNKQRLDAKAIHVLPEEETATFEFEKPLEIGEATLFIEFQGQLSDKLNGFYRSKYQWNNEERYMAVTQFEPVDARKAFPCWDEPAHKATFQVTLTFPSHLQALSNMPPIEEKIDPDNNLKTVKFDTTPIMSTYLLAFAIGEFDYVEGVTSRNVKMRVYTTKGKSHLGKFALDVGIKVLTYFEDYFNIPYPLPKQDMIAIPDFSAGAMENWGLITFREVTLLCDENSSISTRFRVAYVVAHELAHQWFGNLVTMEWWKELWLNEGFATFAGNQAVDHLFPMWNVWTRFVSSYTFSALQKDSLKSSHPIEVEVKHSREVDEIFDAISYNKGAAVIRMIADYLTEPVFKRGLNIYLNRHKYRNATTVDLWRALSDASAVSVIDIMDKWTQAVGYPVVSVQEGTKEGEFHITQKRFLSSGPVVNEEDDRTVWWVNLAIRSSNLKTPKFVTIKEKKTTIKVPELRGAEWVKFNSGQSGVYRVQYSPTLLKKLLPAVASNSLDAVDRLGIQNDAFALAQSGHISLSEALSLAQAYENETDFTVWSDLTENLNNVLSIWAQEPVYPLFKKFMIKLYRKIGERVGWEASPNEDDLTKLLRSVVLSVLGTNGDQNVISEAKRRFVNYLKQPETLNPNLRETVFKLVMRYGGEEEYNTMQSLYEKPDNTPEEKIRTLRCLGCSNDPKLISKYLDYALKSGKVREQDFFICVNVAFSTPEGREVTWNFIKTHWDEIYRKFAGQLMLLGRYISPASEFTSEEKAQEVEQFFEKKNITGIERTLKQTVETIRSRAAYLNRARADVKVFLEKQT